MFIGCGILQKWYFSVIDIVAVLTEQKDYDKANNYWRKLKQRLKEEGSEVVTNCHGLKMKAKDGKCCLNYYFSYTINFFIYLSLVTLYLYTLLLHKLSTF